MTAIFDTITSYFERIEWSFAPVEDGTAIVLRFTGDDDEWSCVAEALEEERVVMFFSILPVDAPDDRRAAVAEFVTRANHGMLTGAFELDLDTGDVRYRTSIRMAALPDGAFAELGLAQTLVHEAVTTNVMTMNAYIAGLRQVVDGADPAPTIDAIESVSDE